MARNKPIRMRLRFEARDWLTHERLYPGDLVEVTMRGLFGGLDEDGNKKFYNKYSLIRRNMKARQNAKQPTAYTRGCRKAKKRW